MLFHNKRLPSKTMAARDRMGWQKHLLSNGKVIELNEIPIDATKIMKGHST